MHKEESWKEVTHQATEKTNREQREDEYEKQQEELII